MLPRLHFSSDLLGEIFASLTSAPSSENSNFLLARVALEEAVSNRDLRLAQLVKQKPGPPVRSHKEVEVQLRLTARCERDEHGLLHVAKREITDLCLDLFRKVNAFAKQDRQASGRQAHELDHTLNASTFGQFMHPGLVPIPADFIHVLPCAFADPLSLIHI